MPGSSTTLVEPERGNRSPPDLLYIAQKMSASITCRSGLKYKHHFVSWYANRTRRILPITEVQVSYLLSTGIPREHRPPKSITTPFAAFRQNCMSKRRSGTGHDEEKTATCRR